MLLSNISNKNISKIINMIFSKALADILKTAWIFGNAKALHPTQRNFAPTWQCQMQPNVHRFTKKQSNRKCKLGTQVYLEEVISEPHHSTLSRFILKKNIARSFLSLSLSSVKCINQHCMEILVEHILYTYSKNIYQMIIKCSWFWWHARERVVCLRKDFLPFCLSAPCGSPAYRRESSARTRYLSEASSNQSWADTSKELSFWAAQNDNP